MCVLIRFSTTFQQKKNVMGKIQLACIIDSRIRLSQMMVLFISFLIQLM